jgi:hypothetical protein
MRLDFAIIGSQKAGTSTLKDALAGQDEIRMHFTDECTFFLDNDLSLSWEEYYRNHYLVDERKEPLIGIKNVGISSSRDAMVKLKDHNSKIKLIFIYRDHFDRIISSYRYNFSRGIEKEKDINKAILPGRVFRDKFSERNCSYIKNTLYADVLTNMYDLFDSEQILILRFEEYIKDPASIYSKIADFLNVDISFDEIRGSRKNKTVDARIPLLNGIFLYKPRMLRSIWKIIPVRIRVSIKESFYRLNSSSYTRDVILNKNSKELILNFIERDKDILRQKFKINLD